MSPDRLLAIQWGLVKAWQLMSHHLPFPALSLSRTILGSTPLGLHPNQDQCQDSGLSCSVLMAA